MDIRRLLVTGGEPILAPYLPDVIRRLTDCGIQALLATNASLMTDKIAGTLRGAELERIQAQEWLLRKRPTIDGPQTIENVTTWDK